MNFFNRVIVIFEAFVGIVLALLLIAAVLAARTQLRQFLEPFFTSVTSDKVDPSQFICVLVLFGIFLLSLLVLLIQIYRPETRHLKLQSAAGTDVSITADAIIRRLEYEIEALAGVIKATPRVWTSGKDKAVNVAMDLLLAPDADLASKTQEITVVTRNVIEQRMSFKAGKIEMKIDHAKLPGIPSAKKTIPPA